MAKDEFIKLFRHINKRFDDVGNKLNSTADKKDVDKIIMRLDSIESQLEISEDERVVIGLQLDKLDRWTHGLADKIGYKLVP